MSTPATTHPPTASDPLDILLAHNQWSNKVLLHACRPLTCQQFHQLFPIGPADRGGLHLTITHIISASGRWADRIRSIHPPRAALEPFPFAPPPGHPAPDARDRTVDELLDLNDRYSADLRDAAAYSRRVGLESTIPLKFPQPPDKGGGFKDYTFTRAACLMHVLTHAHWHRAQCINILRQLGATGDGLPELQVVEWQSQGELFL
jgi:uncharacterized damage-inducible protein DinB